VAASGALRPMLTRRSVPGNLRDRCVALFDLRKELADPSDRTRRRGLAHGLDPARGGRGTWARKWSFQTTMTVDDGIDHIGDIVKRERSFTRPGTIATIVLALMVGIGAPAGSFSDERSLGNETSTSIEMAGVDSNRGNMHPGPAPIGELTVANTWLPGTRVCNAIKSSCQSLISASGVRVGCGKVTGSLQSSSRSPSVSKCRCSIRTSAANTERPG